MRARRDFNAEVLDSWKKVENAVVSISSVGLSVDGEAANEAQAAVSAAQSLIAEMFPAVLAVARNGDEDVRLSVVPFLQAYINKLKTTQKRLGSMPEVRLMPSMHRVSCWGLGSDHRVEGLGFSRP